MFVELHTVGAAPTGPSGFSSDQTQTNVPKWRKCLEDSGRHSCASYSKALHELHDQEKAQNQICHRCNLPKYRLDFCEFLCTPEKRANKAPFQPRDQRNEAPHRFCQDCVAAMIKNQARSNLLEADIQRLLGEQLMLIPCPLCRSPNVLTSEKRFHEGFERQNCSKNGVMKYFSVHANATRLLSENYVVEECYENQRRPPFGVFTKENLWETDWCGQHSTRGKTCIEDREAYFAPPNGAWKWLEPWEPDVTLGGAFGWMYARRWPASESGWDRIISLFHLVRRRRLLRTRLRVNDTVAAEISQIRDELAVSSKVHLLR